MDYVIIRRIFREHVGNVKPMPGEEINKQHQMLVWDFCADIPPPAKNEFFQSLPNGFHHRDDLKEC